MKRNILYFALSAIGFFMASSFFVSAAVISISPNTGTSSVGDFINLDVRLDTGTVGIDGADIKFLNYNPSLLEMQDQDSSQAGVQILAGSLMPVNVINSVDTAAGKISFSQITAGGTNFSGSGVLAKLKFKVLSPGAANLIFNFTSGNTADTNVASAGADLLTSVTNGAYTLQGVGSTPNPSGIFDQYRQDGTLILEGSSITDTTLVFKGTLSDPSGLKVRMELELRQTTESFTGTSTGVSAFVDSGQTVSITRGGLTPASYRWRARAVNFSGKAGPWVEFGSIGVGVNNSDFIISAGGSSGGTGGGSGGSGDGSYSGGTGSTGSGGGSSGSAGGGGGGGGGGGSSSGSTGSGGIVSIPKSVVISSSPCSANYIFNNDLQIGMRGDEVKKLQELLSRDRIIYPEGLTTGYFGFLTKTAVIRFQKKYGISPIGRVGPATRKKLNEIFGSQGLVSQQNCGGSSSLSESALQELKKSLEIQLLQLRLKLLQEQLKLLLLQKK